MRSTRLSVFHLLHSTLRGRMTQERKIITGTGTFTTSYGYDAMDRVVTTTYPSGEVVTQPLRLRSGQALQRRSATYNLNYANNMTASRNALGQLTQMTHGNNLATTYTYDSLRFRLTRIQAGSWLTLSYG
jgi:YD repeat-containing protein